MNMTPQESKDFIDSLTPEQQKKAAEMLESAMDTVETYWASNNEKATRTANAQRSKLRRICEEIKEAK